MTRYGYYSTNPPLFGFTNDNLDNLRASVGDSMPENGHAYSAGFYGGYFDPSDPVTARVGIYTTTSGNPTTFGVGTGSISVNDRMIESSDGQVYEADLTASYALVSGRKYGVAILGDGGRLAHGQGSTGWMMYFRNYTPSTFPSPMGYTTAQTETRIAAWINYEPNVAPNAPSSLSPVDGTTTTNTTPTYAATFVDANQLLPNGMTSDYLAAYQIQVRSVAAENATTGTVVWDSGTLAASGAEQSSGIMSKVHAGTALSLGTRYQWRCRHQDRFSAWSAWSHPDGTAWQDLFVASGGVVTLDGTPTGRQTDRTPDFQGRFHHVSGTAADRVQVQLYTTDINGANEVLFATSAEITKAVTSSALPGTLFTITAAESGFGTLPSGVRWGYKIRARTAAPAWSDYSTLRTFFTNSQPSTPTTLTPTGSLPVTTYPILSCYVSDPDGDTLTVSARIKNSGGTVLFTRTMTKVGATTQYTYQTTGTDIATYATYKWDASATDGDLTSAFSTEATFVYAQGPAVTVTAPTENQVLTTDTPTFTWTTTDQQKKRVRVYNDVDDSLIHDSTELTSTVQNYVMPADILANNGDYYATIEVKNSAPLTGTSAIRNFTLVYPAPATVTNFLATPELADFDVKPSVNRLTWTPVTTPLGNFIEYVITRRYPDTAYTTATVIGRPTSRDLDTWIDTTPESGVPHVYGIVQRVQESSIDILTSVPATASAQVNLFGPTISDVRAGLSLRIAFESIEDLSEETRRDATDIATWDGGPPWQFEGPTHYKALPLAARLRAMDEYSVHDQLAALRGPPAQEGRYVPPYGGLAGVRADGSLVLSCYRDQTGRKFFGRVRGVNVIDRRLLRADVELEFVQASYEEAV